jgi:hypothetical protein
MTFASECELRRWLFQNFDVPAHEDCDHHCPDCGETFGSRAHEVAHSADVDTADRDELEAAAAIYDETAS